MVDHQLDLTPLNRAIDRLDEGLARYRREIGDLQIRDGLIQRFEFIYEISHKMLKRYLTLTSPSPTQYNEMAFQDLIRTGNELGLLLGAWPDWKRYRDLRSKTSHTYDEDIALEVVSGIPAFLAEARHLQEQIKARLL